MASDRAQSDKAHLLRNNGNSRLRLDKYEEAIKFFTEALELNPDYIDARLDRAKAYSALKRHEEAIADCTSIIETKPSAEAYMARARYYDEQGDIDKAITDCMEIIVRLDPANKDALFMLSGLYFKKSGRPSELLFTLNTSKDANNTTYSEYKDDIDTLNISPETKKILMKEADKLKLVTKEGIPYSPQDYESAKNYLDIVVNLPWDDPAPEHFNLKDAAAILDEEHYGLWDVKNRVLEFLAVRKMRQNTKGAILCFAGPPGVGKTSMGQCIARTLGRKFYRFSVGGINDVSAIRGGRRFWVGAEPGRIIQGLRIKESKAIVIMIDEVDKLATQGGVNGGSPASALLEVLDPEQNDTFRDSYLDIPFDLSNVFFILTANELKDMPKPLLDRMEIIQIPGYIDEEKLQIARKYLIPKSLKKNGLEESQVSWDDDEAILHISNSYEKELGVRQLEQNLDKIHRKIVRQIIEQQESAGGETKNNTFSIDKQQVEKYLGEPPYSEDKIRKQKADRPGMAVGLAVENGVMGLPLLIETVSVPGEEGYTITGNMKTVMKESVETAFSYARKFAIEHDYCDRSWFKENHVHIHFPTAISKDGNSAGIAIATALLSLFKNQVITDKVVMTGEITLTGKVLAIGGLKEKIIGAKNNNAKHIIFPKENMRDFEKIPNTVIEAYRKEGIQFHPVERFEEVLALVLPD